MPSSLGSALSRRAAIGACLVPVTGEQAMAQARGSGRSAAPVGHVVLLGDSILDNSGYLAGSGPDVVAQLRGRLPAGWQTTLAARGGSVLGDVPSQLERLPAGTSHLVISAGGNDAARQEGVLREIASSVAEGLSRLATLRGRFSEDYRAMLDRVLQRQLPTAVCTIYNPRFQDLTRRTVVAAALTVFNDVITREAFARGLPLIDLRLICASDRDFAGPTGPSVQGGEKIAGAIAELIARHDFQQRRSEVFTEPRSGG